jgi:hypothetical protein
MNETQKLETCLYVWFMQWMIVIAYGISTQADKWNSSDKELKCEKVKFMTLKLQNKTNDPRFPL